MQVENIGGLTAEDIDTVLEYLELVSETLEEVPGAMVNISQKLLDKPELFLKLAAFMARAE